MNKEAIVQRLSDSILAARGIQVQRKDKDLMQDTGGTSKGRDREPSQKPPRDDVKHRDRPKDKPAPDRDRDTDTDKDTNSDKDKKLAGIFGLNIPEPTYADKVADALTYILEVERGVSEKSFDAYDALIAESKATVEANMDLVSQFGTGNARPQLCAEVLYGVKMACDKSLIFSPISRVASNAAKATGILAQFPQTFRALVQKEG